MYICIDAQAAPKECISNNTHAENKSSKTHLFKIHRIDCSTRRFIQRRLQISAASRAPPLPLITSSRHVLVSFEVFCVSACQGNA